ncbi:MAG TPA: ABC transporter substrate-binding protein [Bosea sp. (in: a-proteobacteria)]|jgi:NitT/TauT family transport system substrate-binding protein|uniref:ABC transporter substrate-binding protein n=1 Tax=Bosea sp. (in: a-proteobacteria) TaxID=1871050 RepID=UPI002E15A36F|nr:ABC transporter substrate-binding protein [Bosea sp. (in: a-proteobacteria)]
MLRRTLLTAAAVLALGTTGALAQAGGKPMKITLNFLAAAPNAGFMMAKQMGLYEKAGINLTIEEGKGSGTTAQMVATGQSDVGFADAPAAMQLRTKGAPVKIVAPVLQTNGFAIISLEESGIASPKDLIGKKLAVQPGTAQTILLDAILASNQIDKSKVDVINIDPGAFVGALLEKKVDAILGGADFHSIQIRERGFKVRDMFYRDVGVPTVGLSIIARDDRIKADADLYKKFIEASLQGWDAARKNPDAAADAVVAQFPAVKKAQVLAQFEVVNKLLCAPGATALGKVPEKNWNTSFELLTQYLGLPKDKPITDYYTTELLPASPPACS